MPPIVRPARRWDHPRPCRGDARVARRLAAVGAAIVLVASCESGGRTPVGPQPTSPTSAAPPGGPAPCALITSNEAEAFLGRSVGAPTPEAGRCTWPATDGKGFVTVTVNTGSHSRTMLSASRVSDRGEPVKGIGEDAYISLPGNELGIAAFVHGQVAVSILVRSPTRDRATLLELAATAAHRA